MSILQLIRNPIASKLKYLVFTDYFNQSLNRISAKAFHERQELGDAYVPEEIENRPLEDWLFKPPVKTHGSTFKMILPPPNITGTLHLGHALTATIQDVIIKWKRMNGIDTLWVPGMDHAGIATQVIVEKKLWAERRRRRHDIEREEFLREVWRWKKEKSDVIAHQLRRLGLSLNWEHEFFTMDEQQSAAVVETFIKLHSEGLIYEANAPVNWSCALQSAISDVEVEHLEISGPTKLHLPNCPRPVIFGQLFEFAYKLAHEPNTEVLVATTRPETILGDVALAVHPSDHRHTSLIGKQVLHPFDNTLMPIISDGFVDVNFGTGVVKLTPGHSQADHDCCLRHRLPVKSVLDEQGRVTGNSVFTGMDRFDARDAIIKALEGWGLLRGVKDHGMSVPLCSRSGDVIETIVKPQWFVDCQQMARRALDDVAEGRIRISPQRFEQNWAHWLENIRPWCISRQLWWGHRIPAYHCSDNQGTSLTIVARNEDEAREIAERKLGTPNAHIVQVDDVLDTWFSSALLPLTTGEQRINLMETGHDILFFWVARMVMLCTHLRGHVPFDRVLLHGVLCDAHGRKMSKSVGNVIAPEDVIHGRTFRELERDTAKAQSEGLLSESEASKASQMRRKMFPEGISACGADALRFTLCSHNAQNQFIHFDAHECLTNKFFGNKVWQATRFTHKWQAELSMHHDEGWRDNNELHDLDMWILSRLDNMLTQVNNSLHQNDFHEATAVLKQFLHFELCDVYVEVSKRGLRQGRTLHVRILHECLTKGARALAPFMPYLSQHLLAHLCADKHPTDVYYPRSENRYRNCELEQRVADLRIVVMAVRRLKRLFNVTAKHQPQVIINGSNEFLRCNADVLADLAGCAFVRFDSLEEVGHSDYFSDRVGSVGILLHVPKELQTKFRIDVEKLQTKRSKLAKELDKLQTHMSAEAYNVSGSVHRINVKKSEQLEEKIARIDYVQRLSVDKLHE